MVCDAWAMTNVIEIFHAVSQLSGRLYSNAWMGFVGIMICGVPGFGPTGSQNLNIAPSFGFCDTSKSTKEGSLGCIGKGKSEAGSPLGAAGNSPSVDSIECAGSVTSANN